MEGLTIKRALSERDSIFRRANEIVGRKLIWRKNKYKDRNLCLYL
jgi:hypothetical protein